MIIENIAHALQLLAFRLQRNDINSSAKDDTQNDEEYNKSETDGSEETRSEAGSETSTYSSSELYYNVDLSKFAAQQANS